MAASLCGCATAGKNAPSSLKVEIPDTCERILRTVPLPAVKPTDDARVAFIKDDAAVLAANGRIAAGRRCIADVRARLKGKP